MYLANNLRTVGTKAAIKILSKVTLMKVFTVDCNGTIGRVSSTY